jgi:hypothetical protein
MSTSTTVSAWSMMSTSALTHLTVSSRIHVAPGGVHQQRGLQRRLAGDRRARQAVGHRADEHARVEKWSLSRIHRPAARPVNGNARRRLHPPPLCPPSRSCFVRALISVDWPTPGGPVKPMIAALPLFGYTLVTSSQPSGLSFSTSEIARASARLSPARRRCARVCAVSAMKPTMRGRPWPLGWWVYTERSAGSIAWVLDSQLTSADALVVDGIEAAVKAKHRRRLRRLGWSRALDGDGDGLWATANTPPRAGCDLRV